MKKKTCIDCNSEAVSHIIKRHTLFVTTEEITFSCGARQMERFDSERSIGTVEFEGCAEAVELEDCACAA